MGNDPFFRRPIFLARPWLKEIIVTRTWNGGGGRKILSGPPPPSSFRLPKHGRGERREKKTRLGPLFLALKSQTEREFNRDWFGWSGELDWEDHQFPPNNKAVLSPPFFLGRTHTRFSHLFSLFFLVIKVDRASGSDTTKTINHFPTVRTKQSVCVSLEKGVEKKPDHFFPYLGNWDTPVYVAFLEGRPWT